MRIPTQVSRSLRPVRILATGGLALTIGLGFAACGGSAVSPSVAAGVPSAAAATATLLPSVAATVVPSPAPSLPALTLLWEGSGPKQAKPGTYWPAIDPVTGNVWVASSFDNKFWIFNPDGTYLETWGQAGTGNGQFDLATHDQNPDAEGAIAFAPDGSFYVLDTGNYRVEKFDKARHFVTTWGTFGTGDGQFANPKGIATDGQIVYVADDPRGDMQAFDASGKFLRSFPFPFVLFSLGPDGRLYSGDFLQATNEAGVGVFDAMGKQVAQFDLTSDDFQGGSPAQVSVSKAGHIFVPIQERTSGSPFALIELDGKGTVLNRWSVGGETSALTPDEKAIYFAYTAPQGGWTFIRKYALPAQ